MDVLFLWLEFEDNTRETFWLQKRNWSQSAVCHLDECVCGRRLCRESGCMQEKERLALYSERPALAYIRQTS